MTRPAGSVLAPLLCPRCGGGLGVREGARIGRCAHCGTSFLARFPGDDPRYVLFPTLDARGAAARVRDLLRGSDLPGDLLRRAVLQGTDLFFVPYWRFQATVVGRLRGTRQVRRRIHTAEGDEAGTRHLFHQELEIRRTEQVDKPIREIWRATLSACPVDDLGVPTLSALRQRSAGMDVTRDLAGLPGLRFFDATPFEVGKVLDVMVPRERAREQADALMRRFLDTRGFDVEEKELRVLRMQERAYLLYYPVFRVRFRYRGRIFRVTLDGHDGSLVHAHLPGDLRLALAAVLAGTLAAALLTAAPLRLVVAPPAGLAELASLRLDPRLWLAAAAVATGLVAAARHALTRFHFDAERVVRG